MNLSEDILFYAFRYTLGRMTYAVSTVADEIIRNAASIGRNTRFIMIEEINKALRDDDAGMECDRRSWERVMKALQDQQERESTTNDPQATYS